ncbi:MAG: neutral/alkaline non-lysosomal ceramidase N-terminal domain-containing protein, partial [Phycisphaerae bacterium]|nr:neutral/alkaline non-lysosomal ceramidase N-terminal domain-containing protein [Phycisphaerae bacterium]
METYEIGLSCVEITPPVGTPLAGNFRDDYASRGVYAPLCSRTVVIRREDTAIAIISNDLLTVPDRLVRLVRQGISSRCGLKPDCIMVSAIHTHSGPAVEAISDEADGEKIQDMVIPGIIESCVQALESCKPMHLWAAAGKAEGVCFNRRLKLTDGQTVMNWTRPPADSIDRPLGPVDTEVGILATGQTSENPSLVLANLALHSAILAGDNWLMGTDWPGYYYDSIHKVFGPNTQAMFLQGAEGNVNHIDARDAQQGRGFKEAQRVGSVVGLSVIDALRDARLVSGPIKSSSL